MTIKREFLYYDIVFLKIEIALLNIRDNGNIIYSQLFLNQKEKNEKIMNGHLLPIGSIKIFTIFIVPFLYIFCLEISFKLSCSQIWSVRKPPQQLNERITGTGRDTTVVVFVPRHLYITAITPGNTPAVLHQPIIITVIIRAVTNDQHAMVQRVGRAFRFVVYT